MFPLDQQAFQHVNSTAPSFNSTADGSAALFALESTTINRVFPYPGSRAVRLMGNGSGLFYFKTGTSDVVAASSNSVLCPGNTPLIFTALPSHTHISFVSSTSVTVNVTLGVGK